MKLRTGILQMQFSLDKHNLPYYNKKAVSGCSAAGSALGSGPRGRGFESRHSDSDAVCSFLYMAFFLRKNQKNTDIEQRKVLYYAQIILFLSFLTIDI